MNMMDLETSSTNTYTIFIMELSRYEKDKIISLKFLQLFFRLKNVFNIFFAMSFPIPFHSRNQSKIELIKKMNAVSPLHEVNEQLNFWIKELETNGLVHFGWTKAKGMFEFSMSSINFLILFSQKPIFQNYSIRQELLMEQLLHELESCKKSFFEIKNEANSFFCLQLIFSSFMFNQIQYIQETCQNVIPSFQIFFCNNIKPADEITKESRQKSVKHKPEALKDDYFKEDELPCENRQLDEQERSLQSVSEPAFESSSNDLTNASNCESSASSVTCSDFAEPFKNIQKKTIQEQPNVIFDHQLDKDDPSRFQLGKEFLEFERYNIELLQFQVAIGSLQTVHYEFQDTLKNMQLLESTEASICKTV
ncbi:hypothetical protein SOMG_01530 [Schizosaccharomyces osmophilus]|uniref:Uncharacterized protein n=1 Tax=Schizosaccharomyces osmophilus TaxID=2545709 RepID=A0AAF0ATT5_9SCHI|nr:uncharacterized protein SOMG_01530 [Schizosaccharomyces osmophilus]WBW70713.1 hypothetical protein SOMG_01530 [Schizosaccharomyces osmophilus]